MKKTISILLLVLLIAGVFISCDNKVNDNINEIVSVTFSSDDVTSSNPLFDVSALYWKYTAEKADETGLTQGATLEQRWIYGGSASNSTQTGLGVVGGFSQGLWKFTLYGYSDAAGSTLICQGSTTTTSIKFGSDNNVKVKVNPVTTSGNGTIDLSKLTVKCGEAEITNWSIGSVSYNPTTESEVSGKVLQNVMPGTYSITITIKNDDGTVYDPYTLKQDITVYSNLTTTVTEVLSVSAASPSSETVSVTFINDDVTSSNPLFDVSALYWKYTAEKADETGLTQGATLEQRWIYGGSASNSTQTGLGVVGGFSQGLWNFTLYGYSDNTGSTLICQGSTTTTSINSESNNVNVKVNPVTTSGNGKIDLSGLTVKCNETVISNWSISSVSYDPMPDESSISGKELTVTPGTYRITITIINNDNPLIVYNSYILEQDITVYSNLTTTVTGVLSVSASSETVSVTFSSDDVTSSNPLFNVDALYWKYSAKKNSADNNPNLNSGATSSNYATDEAGAVAIGQGLNATLSGFSQGLWDFKLFAYKDSDYKKLAYGGEAKGVRLECGKDNVVNVEVSPYSDQGPGTIDLSGLTVKCGEAEITNWSISSIIYNNYPLVFSGKELTIAPGTYTITINIKNEEAPLTVYDSCILEQITVYSNLTTTVTSSISLSINSILELKPIGGVIYYDAGDNGQTYTFYDSNNNKIEYTGNSISELQNAKYYTVSGNRAEGKGDRFFVVYNKLLYTEDDKVYWGFYGTSSGTYTTDCSGKINTATIVTYIKEKDLLKETPVEINNQVAKNKYKNCGTTGKYLWDYLIAFNDKDKTSGINIENAIENTSGVYDWYIPSYIEMDILFANYSIINSYLNLSGIYKTSNVYNNIAENYFYAYNWARKNWEKTGKYSMSENCVVIRSF